MNHEDWLTTWYTPEDDDVIAYISLDRIATIGGADPETFGLNFGPTTNQVNQGISILLKWCRLNCIQPGKPVSVMGNTGFAFKHQQDALLFKLTWA